MTWRGRLLVAILVSVAACAGNQGETTTTSVSSTSATMAGTEVEASQTTTPGTTPETWVGVTFTVGRQGGPHDVLVEGEPTGLSTPWWVVQPCCDDHALVVVTSPGPEEFDSERIGMIWVTTRGDIPPDYSRTVLLSEDFVLAPGAAIPDGCDDGTPGTSSERFFGIVNKPPPVLQQPLIAWRVRIQGIEQVDTAAIRCGFIID